MEYINYLLLFFIFLFLPFVCGGIIRKIRAMAQGRMGPPVLQNYFDFIRLWGKTPIDGPYSGFYASSAPISVFLIGIFIYSISVFEWIPLLLLPFFLTLQRVFLIGYAMETGSSFGGLGTSREILLSITSEPILILSILVSQSKIHVDFHWLGLALGTLFLGSFLVSILAELSKPPFDDPRTHLELTMVHEAMLLEASGRTLAFFEGANQLKIATFFVILNRIGLEHTNFLQLSKYHEVVANLIVLFGSLALSVLIGYWEAISVRRKWIWIPEVMGMTFLFLLVLGTLVKL
ncbi:MAG: NADH-quinone oxidoreductase subunit H [Leptospiraceae bacterium]|nr:NADH-quinone oxidoreductase subunit H [Leptospiraceae bacterium]MCP5512012.1 NADH-quinone oxidoreductase subunit H [Leptospiraceae bacterium]